MKISERGIDLVKQFEGLRLEAYQDAAGVWTIGYGHTGQDVRAGDTITEAEAERLLRLDLLSAELAVQRLVKVPLVQPQFDALVSFVFNLGAENLKSSTLLRLLNDGLYAHAAQQFNLWVHAKGQRLPGLVRRRAAERALFESAGGITDAGGPAPATAAAGASEPAAPPAPQPVGWDSQQGDSHRPALTQPPAPVEDRPLPRFKEPTMPAPAVVPILSALVPALLPKLVALIPELATIFTDREKRSADQYIEAGTKVLETITTATNARNAQEAVETIAADPVAKQAAQTAIRERWYELQEVAGGIAAAREANAAAIPIWGLGLRFHEVLTLGLVTGAYVIGGVYLFSGSPAPEMAAALVTALVISSIGAVVAYWFGSTSGSAHKSDLLAKK